VSGPDELLRQIADFLTIVEKKMIPADAALVLATALVMDCRTHIAANAVLAARCGELESALGFYAKRQHLYGSIAEDWDSASGEADNWLWPSEPAENESWGVENGYVAQCAIDGRKLIINDEGELVGIEPERALASQAEGER
jgi:hypothetical protein